MRAVNRFPTYDCPNPECKAKNVLFATNKCVRNNSKLITFDKVNVHMCVDYIMICPKCKKKLALWNCDLVNVPVIS